MSIYIYKIDKTEEKVFVHTVGLRVTDKIHIGCEGISRNEDY